MPLTWIRKQRENFRSYLLCAPDVQYRFNAKEYSIHFTGCSLYPQGYPAIVNRLGDFKGTNLLADIGNGTMNILYVNNKKAVENRCWTEKFGVNQCMLSEMKNTGDIARKRIYDRILERCVPVRINNQNIREQIASESMKQAKNLFS